MCSGAPQAGLLGQPLPAQGDPRITPPCRAGVRALAQRHGPAAGRARPVSGIQPDPARRGPLPAVDCGAPGPGSRLSQLHRHLQVEDLPDGTVPGPAPGRVPPAPGWVPRWAPGPLGRRGRGVPASPDLPSAVGVVTSLSKCYSSLLDSMNAEIRIRWLQIVVRNDYYPDLHRVRRFLESQVWPLHGPCPPTPPPQLTLWSGCSGWVSQRTRWGRHGAWGRCHMGGAQTPPVPTEVNCRGQAGRRTSPTEAEV